MLSLGSLATALCVLALLPGRLGLRPCGSWVRFRSNAPAPAPALALALQGLDADAEPLAWLLPFPPRRLREGLAWLDTVWVFSVDWRAACLLSGALLVRYLSSLARRPWRQKVLQAAAVPLEKNRQGKCSCNSYEVLCRVEANALLTSKYLRRLRHLHLEESKRQPSKKKTEDTGDKEKVLSDCIRQPGSGAESEAQGN